jgi:hypothetical protein
MGKILGVKVCASLNLSGPKSGVHLSNRIEREVFGPDCGNLKLGY